MYTHYWARFSAAMVPQMVLEELGEAYTLVRVDISDDRPRDPAYLALNPAGTVPTLDHDGLIVRELAAISLYLADRHGRADLAPAPTDPLRGPFLQWMMYLTNTVHATARQEYFAGTWTDDGAAVPRIKANAMARLETSFDVIERALDPGPYLLGARYSIADPFLLVETHFHPETAALLAKRPRLARAAALVEARPAGARVLAANRN